MNRYILLVFCTLSFLFCLQGTAQNSPKFKLCLHAYVMEKPTLDPFSTIGDISPGQMVEVKGLKNGRFFEIDYEGKTGYINQYKFEFSESLANYVKSQNGKLVISEKWCAYEDHHWTNTSFHAPDPHSYHAHPHSNTSSSSYKSTATQCLGVTQKGTRCRRRTTNSSGYCWQH